MSSAKQIVGSPFAFETTTMSENGILTFLPLLGLMLALRSELACAGADDSTQGNPSRIAAPEYVGINDDTK